MIRTIIAMASLIVFADCRDAICQAKASQPIQSATFGSRGPEARAAWAAGCQFATARNPGCLEHFYRTAVLSWEDLEEGLADPQPRLHRGTLQLYNSAVLSCVLSAHRLGRLPLTEGVKLETGQVIPLVSVGVAWRLEEIDHLQAASAQLDDPVLAQSVRFGLGASLLGIRHRRAHIPSDKRFLKTHPVAMTAVLRPFQSDAGTREFRFELHNPGLDHRIAIHGQPVMLSKNIAAAVEFAVQSLMTDYNPFTTFLQPDIAVDHEGLLLLQPYRPGKIPVVLVHGLLSNPATWGRMINEILNNPALMERYQIWAYMYPTSVPYLKTAADFRQDLNETRHFFDPHHTEPALDHIMLVGHSMGGLISRLQVTWSCNHLWDAFVTVPIWQIQTNETFRQLLAKSFFFGPRPFIKRVVFIAVPHRGSSLASRFIGIVGRILAGRVPELQDQWERLIDDNPDAFQKGIKRRLPSSVAGLSTKSPGLKAMQKMPFNPHVRLHSIIGTGGCNPVSPGDGVVAVSSARLAGVDSELFVDATHTRINENQQTIREVIRILWVHWDAYESTRPVRSPVGPSPGPQNPVEVPAPTPVVE